MGVGVYIKGVAMLGCDWRGKLAHGGVGGVCGRVRCQRRRHAMMCDSLGGWW